MKLGMLIPEYPTQTHIFFWREIQALRRLGIDVHILSTRRPVDPCPHQFARDTGAEAHYIFPPGWQSVAQLGASPLRMGQVVRAAIAAEEPWARRLRILGLCTAAEELVRYARRVGLDHVHVHSCADAAYVGEWSRILGGPPFSLHLHGDATVYGGGYAVKAKDAAFVAVAAPPLASQVADLTGIDPSRILVLPMGVETERFIPLAERPSGQVLTLITVARLVRGKGHRLALEAIRAVVDRGLDVRYSIVGSGPDRADLEALIAQLGLGEKARLLGSLDEGAVLQELRRSDVFLLPSVGVFEASPVSLMEAMSCGLAAVVSRIGGTSAMIDDGVDGFLIEQGDVPALAARIERLCREPETLRRIGIAARKRAVASFDCSARATTLRDFIESRDHPSPIPNGGSPSV
jgi:colanic acid/amylovoran biosynthesis glycosyltransferase